MEFLLLAAGGRDGQAAWCAVVSGDADFPASPQRL